MLLSLAVGWIKPLGMPGALPYAFAGFLLAPVLYTFGFAKLAGKNVGRIEQIRGEKTGLLAFQEWKSYPLIVFMIAFGLILRHYTPIPKPFLAILYIGIGGGLFLSSLRYYGHIWNGRTTNNDT